MSRAKPSGGAHRPVTLGDAARTALGAFRAWWSPPDDRQGDDRAADTGEEKSARDASDSRRSREVVDSRRSREVVDSRRSRDEAAMAEYLDNLPAGIFSADADGRMLYVNRTLADWLGRPAGAIVGRPFADFVVEATPFPLPPEGAANAFDGGDVVLADDAGGSFPAVLLQTVRAGADGRPLYTRSLVMRDFARRAETAPAAPALPAWLFERSPVGIALLDYSGIVAECNDAFLALVGAPRDAVIGRPLAERLAPEDRAEAAAQFSKLVMGTAPTSRCGWSARKGPSAPPRSTPVRRAKTATTAWCCTWSTPPSASTWRSSSPRRRRCSPWASSRAASPTTSTTCSPP